MIPELTKIELQLQSKLELNSASHLWNGYAKARDHLMKEVLPHIHRVEPFLTDHGPDHVLNVLNNANELIQDHMDNMTHLDLYILCLSCLMHDVGNIEGRRDHHKNISRIFDDSRGKDDKLRREKRLISLIVGAHSGLSSTGNCDTLNDLAKTEVFESSVVHVQEIATLLRFADECAEGKQRTSEEIIKSSKTPDDSKKYHLYALNTDLAIISDGRIAVSHDVTVDVVDGDLCVIKKNHEEHSATSIDYSISLEEYFSMLSERIVKLDTERKYARYYSNILGKFKSVSISITFWSDGKPLVDHSINYELDDKAVPPGAVSKSYFSDNGIDVSKIKENLNYEINAARP